MSYTKRRQPLYRPGVIGWYSRALATEVGDDAHAVSRRHLSSISVLRNASICVCRYRIRPYGRIRRRLSPREILFGEQPGCRCWLRYTLACDMLIAAAVRYHSPPSEICFQRGRYTQNSTSTGSHIRRYRLASPAQASQRVGMPKCLVVSSANSRQAFGSGHRITISASGRLSRRSLAEYRTRR